MNKQESYKTCMILMISSDGNQSNVFFLFLLTTDRHFVRFLGRRYRPPLYMGILGQNLGPICAKKWKNIHFLNFHKIDKIVIKMISSIETKFKLKFVLQKSICGGFGAKVWARFGSKMV